MISKRSSVESSSFGIGVSTGVRKTIREFYSKQGIDAIVVMKNKDLNDVIASDFLKAAGDPPYFSKAYHKFVLKSGEIAVVAKSNRLFYIAAIRAGGAKVDIISVQYLIKEPSPEVRKRRLSKEWKPTTH